MRHHKWNEEQLIDLLKQNEAGVPAAHLFNASLLTLYSASYIVSPARWATMITRATCFFSLARKLEHRGFSIFDNVLNLLSSGFLSILSAGKNCQHSN